MPIKIEAAVVTQKGTEAQFNSDSININKKVLPREVIANGYKGAGTVSGKSFFALASSPVESCADAAVTSLNERCSQFLAQDADVQKVFAEYFSDITGALLEMGYASDAFSCAVFYADDNTVVISQTGAAKCFRYSDEKLYFVDPVLTEYSDNASQYGSCRFDDVKEGDLFFLLNENVANMLNHELLEHICRQCNGNPKIAIKAILSKVQSELNSGVFVLKVLEKPDAVLPVEENSNLSDENEFPVTAAVVGSDEASETTADKETEKEKSEKSKANSKAVVFALSAMAVVLLFIVGVFAGRYIKDIEKLASETETTVEETSTEEATEETTAEETTADETTEEETTEEETEETTTRRVSSVYSNNVVTTTRVQETTTRKQSVTTTTTTTVAAITTTAKSPEETTASAQESMTEEEPATDSAETTTADETEATTAEETTAGATTAVETTVPQETPGESEAE